MVSNLFSCSSDASVAIYVERLKPDINTIRASSVPLSDLVASAEKIVKQIFAPDPRSHYTYKTDYDEISLKLDNVMLAMLAHAEECGGESGQRYVASAILACSKQDEVIGALEALGTTWLTHFLFILKISSLRDHKNYDWEEERSSFCDNVLRRDGYTCVVSGYQDHWHPMPDRSNPKVILDAAHVLSWPMSRNVSAICENDVVSFDILVNYTSLSAKTLEELYTDLNSPTNGIALQYDAHFGFGTYRWTLNKTTEEHVYFVRVFGEDNASGILRLPSKFISFRDHSDDFPISSRGKKKCSVALPNPRYFEIHAAIAGVMNTSGASTFYDKLLSGYEDDDGKVPAVESWSEFESLMEERMLEESVTTMFQTSSIH